MIGLLRGKIISKTPPQLLIDVQGVGYEVEASMNTFYKLPEDQQEITIHTHTVVREDAHLLFGFYELQERTLFRTLIKVNGVGPKLALTILSSIDPDLFVQCVANNDAASLTKLPGIGKKTAERLLVEMRDRLDDWQLSSPATGSASDNIIVRKKPMSDAISALVSLGYKPIDASRAINQIETEGKTSEQLIRDALKAIA